MKVALCLFGQPRFVDYHDKGQCFHAFDNHTEHILSKYDIDVFAHCWVPNENEKFTFGSWISDSFNVVENFNPNFRDIIVDFYKPKEIKFENSKTFYFNENQRIKANDVFNPSKDENVILSQIYSITQSINLIKNIEDYDFIILLRYDAYILKFPNLFELNSDDLYLSNKYEEFCDTIIFGGPKQIKTMAFYDELDEVLDNVKRLPSDNTKLIMSPERLKQSAFLRKFKKEKRLEMQVGYIRSYTYVQL